MSEGYTHKMDTKILKTTKGTEIYFVELEDSEVRFINEITDEWNNYVIKT